MMAFKNAFINCLYKKRDRDYTLYPCLVSLFYKIN